MKLVSDKLQHCRIDNSGRLCVYTEDVRKAILELEGIVKELREFADKPIAFTREIGGKKYEASDRG